LAKVTDISRTELTIALVPLLLVWGIGLYPSPLLHLSQTSIEYFTQVLLTGWTQ
jgi:NADH:ubiquinone oxidoreductase subunit 4 (subunit M)